MDGDEWRPVDRSTALKVQSGELRMPRDGIWWDGSDHEGNRVIKFYPDPF